MWRCIAAWARLVLGGGVAGVAWLAADVLGIGLTAEPPVLAVGFQCFVLAHGLLAVVVRVLRDRLSFLPKRG